MINIENFTIEISSLLNREGDNIFNEILKNSIIGYRATILKQEYDKNGKYPVGSELGICLPMINVSPVECCVSEELDCVTRRTRDKVPTSVRGNFKPDPFAFVGSSNMEKAFAHAKPDEIKYIFEGTKFQKNTILYSFYNQYIYTFNHEGNRLGIRDVFSNPLELLALTNCDGQPCVEDVFIEDDMKRIIKTMLLEEFSRIRQTGDSVEVMLNKENVK